jgi:hypothetical protein
MHEYRIRRRRGSHPNTFLVISLWMGSIWSSPVDEQQHVAGADPCPHIAGRSRVHGLPDAQKPGNGRSELSAELNEWLLLLF